MGKMKAGVNERWLTINAMDDTMIDRGPGYEKEEFFMRRYVIFA